MLTTVASFDRQYIIDTFLERPEQIVERSDEREKNQKSRVLWSVALIVGTLVLGVGVGGFGVAGLLHSYGLQLPQFLQWMTPAIGTIGNTPHFAGLWAMGVGGSVIALGVFIASVVKIVQHSKKIEKLQNPLNTILPDNELSTIDQWRKKYGTNIKGKETEIDQMLKGLTGWTASEENDKLASLPRGVLIIKRNKNMVNKNKEHALNCYSVLIKTFKSEIFYFKNLSPAQAYELIRILENPELLESNYAIKNLINKYEANFYNGVY